MQRRNNGKFVNGSGKHNIPTLPGSSGSPIVTHNKLVGIHVKAGEKTKEEVEVIYKGHQLKLCKNNGYVNMKDVNFDDFNEVERD